MGAAAVGGEVPNALGGTSEGATGTVDDPNAGASSAAVTVVDASRSSVSGASSSASAATNSEAAGAFESLAEQVRTSVHKIRKFLWTFDNSAVAHLHAELDKLEKLV